jgi:hypothetical protein
MVRVLGDRYKTHRLIKLPDVRTDPLSQWHPLGMLPAAFQRLEETTGNTANRFVLLLNIGVI